LAKAIDRCWFVFKWTAALAAVAGGAAALSFYNQLDEEIRCNILNRFARHYPTLKIDLRSAQLLKGRGIRVFDFSITDPAVAGPTAELLRVEEAILECPTDWNELIGGELPLRRVIVRRPKLRAAHRPDGSWGAGQLLPTPCFGNHPPEVVVENGVVEILDSRKAPGGALVLRDLGLTLTPRPDKSPGAREVKGRLSGDGFRGVAFEGIADLGTPSCSLRGGVESLEISPELHAALPEPLSAQWSALAGASKLRGAANVHFELDYDPSAAEPLRYVVSGRLGPARLDDPRLPHGLTDIRAVVRLDREGWSIDDFTARSGRAALHIPSWRQRGFGPNAPMDLSAEFRGLELDSSLYEILPPTLQEHWRKYWPVGEVDADLRLSFDGQTWRPEVAARCQNVAFAHYQFPYRLEQARGKIELKDDVLKIADLTAFAGSRPVSLRAEIAHPFHDPIGWFEAEGKEIPIDEKLIAALPEKTREVVRAFDPGGAIDVAWTTWRNTPVEPFHRRFRLTANRCSIRYEKFPYPLTNIRGDLEMLDDAWTFRGLEGGNHAARITCEGSLTTGLNGKELLLTFTGKDVPLEKELCDALSPHMQRVWFALRPRGAIDLPRAEVRYFPETHQLNLRVEARPQRDSASVEPVFFPYRLDRIEGAWTYVKGAGGEDRVSFTNCKAEHGPVKIAAEGHCDFWSDGRWKTRFTKLSAGPLRTERDLVNALPERLKNAVNALNPTGSIYLDGSLELERMGAWDEPIHSRWDVRLNATQTALRCGGLVLENIHGGVSLAGGFDGQKVQSRGELNLASIAYKDIHLSNVSGPIRIDDSLVSLGRSVDQGADAPAAGAAAPARYVTASLWNGNLFGDGWVVLGPEPKYAVGVRLHGAELALCARDAAMGRQNLRGKLNATIDLTGAGNNRNAWSGGGKIQVTEANVYELPVFIAILKLLSIQPVDANAFKTANIDYRIEGEHIYFNEIEFEGDAISLRGKRNACEMNFQSQIQMTFIATLGSGEVQLNPIKYLLRGAAQTILQIHVGGTLQNPEVVKEVLPLVNQTLQQIQGDSLNRR